MKANPPRLNPNSTWLEIAIGVTILLGLSIVAVPHITRAASRERLEELSDTLHLVRCTVALYRAEHNGLLPGQRNPDQTIAPLDFVRDLIEPETDGRFHYFQRFPENPFIQCDDRRSTVTCVNDPNAHPDGTEGTAWWFNAGTGEFRACDNRFHTAY